MNSYFAYKLIPPSPSFPADMTHTEAATMQDHSACWQKLLSQGAAVVYGPAADPVSTWGLGVVEARTVDEVRALGVADPAVASGMSSFEVYAMPGAIVRS